MTGLLTDDQDKYLDEIRLRGHLDNQIADFVKQSTPPPTPEPAPDPLAQFRAISDQITAPIKRLQDQGYDAVKNFGAEIVKPFQKLAADEKAQQQPLPTTASTSAGVPMPTATPSSGPDDIEGYIRHAAQSRGIDPDVAVRVAQSEGGLDNPTRQSDYINPKTGQREESYGPFQLYMGGGLGNRFQATTGKHPSDATSWKQGVDFALDEAAKGGWGPWYGSARAGIAPRQGLENARSIGISDGSTVASAAGAPQSGAGELGAQSVVQQWAGRKYVFGGPGGRGGGLTDTDCSGFVAQLTGLPAHTDAAYNDILKRGGTEVDPAAAMPNDVVFYMGAGTGGSIAHHMGLYAGPGKVLDMSVANGGGVQERPIEHAGKYVILRDPKLNGPVPPDVAEKPPVLIPSGIAEQTGGTKIKGVSVEQALAANRGMQQKDLNDSYGTINEPPVRDIRGDYTPTASPSAQPGGVEPATLPPVDVAPPPGDSSDPWSAVTNALKNAVTSVFGGGNAAAPTEPTKFQRQQEAIAAQHPQADESNPSIGDLATTWLQPSGLPENQAPDIGGVKPVQRQASLPQSQPLTRDVRGDYATAQPDTIQHNPSEQSRPLTNALTASQQGVAPENLATNVPQQVTQSLIEAAGGNPQNEVAKASRGDAVNPLAWGTEVAYGASDALLSPAARAATIPGTGIAGRDIAAAALDPGNISSPLDILGPLGGIAAAGALKTVGRKAGGKTEQVLHIIDLGYKRGINDEDAASAIEKAIAKAPIDHPMSQSFDEMAGIVDDYAKRRGIPEEKRDEMLTALAKAAAGQDTRDRAFEMLTLMRGSDAALSEFLEKGKAVQDNLASGLIDKDKADELIDLASTQLSTDQFIVGNMNEAKATARALAALRGGVDVKEGQAWLQSQLLLAQQIDGAAKELEQIAGKGKGAGRGPGKGSAKRLEDAADAMDAAAEKFGDDTAKRATSRKPREPKATEEPTVTPPQARDLREFNGPKGVDPEKVQEQLDNEAAARRLQDDLEAEDGVPNSRQKKVDDRPDWSVYYPKEAKPPLEDVPGEPRDATLREQVKVREQMKREIDNKIQKKLDAEKRAITRDEVGELARIAKSRIDDVLSNPGGAGWKEPRDAFDLSLRQLRGHSNLGERVASDIQEVFDRRMDTFINGKIDPKTGKRVGGFTQRLETDISAHDQQVASDVAKDKLKGLRYAADQAQKEIDADPSNRDLRKKLFDLTNEIAATTAGGPGEAVKFYDKEMIHDEARILRELARTMRETPRENFQTGYVDLVNKHLDALRAISDQGRTRADDIRQSMLRKGAKRALGAQSGEDDVRIFLAAMSRVNFDDAASVNKFMHAVAQGSKINMAIEGMMTFMLSSPVTQTVNVLSNIAQGTAHFVVQKPVMVAYDALRHPHNRTLPASELSASKRGITEGLATGLIMAGEVMRGGSTKEARNRAGALADFSGMQREYITEKSPMIGNILHMVSTRPLEAADTIFGQMFYNGNLRALAERKALKSKGELTAIDIIGNLDQHLDVVKEAGRLSDYSLLKKQGSVGSVINDLVRRSDNQDATRLLANLFLPFTRVPENFLRQGLDYSPIGTVANAGRLGIGGLKKDLTPEREAELVAKTVAGGALTGFGIGLYKMGWLTGDGPSDSQQRKELIATGWQPRSFWAGDRWVSYDNLPVTIPFATIATAMEWMEEGSADAKRKGTPANDTLALAGGAGTGAGSALLNQSFLRNLGDAYESVRRGRADKASGNIVKNYASRLEPSLFAWMARLGDHYQRETRDIDETVAGIPHTEELRGTLLERIPGYRGTLPERRNVLGESMINDGNVLAIGPKQSMRRPSPVVDAALSVGVNIPDPPDHLLYPGNLKVPLTEDQKRAYQRAFGENLKTHDGTAARKPPASVIAAWINNAQDAGERALRSSEKYSKQLDEQKAEAIRQAQAAKRGQ